MEILPLKVLYIVIAIHNRDLPILEMGIDDGTLLTSQKPLTVGANAPLFDAAMPAAEPVVDATRIGKRGRRDNIAWGIKESASAMPLPSTTSSFFTSSCLLHRMENTRGLVISIFACYNRCLKSCLGAKDQL